MKPGLKNTLMRVVNLALYLAFCGLVGTGALLYWRLIPGSRGGHGRSLWGWSRHDWGDVHFWLGVTFLAATLLHLFLNWQWLRKIAAKPHIWRLWAGLGLGLAIILFFLAVPIEGRDGQQGGDEHGEVDHPEREGRGPRWMGEE